MVDVSSGDKKTGLSLFEVNQYLGATGSPLYNGCFGILPASSLIEEAGFIEKANP